MEKISLEKAEARKYLIMLLISLLFFFLQNVWSVSNNVLLWIHGPILNEPGTYVRHAGLYGHIPICEENLLDSQN